MLKKLYIYVHMFDIAGTAFICERDLTVSSFLQDFTKGRGSSLQLICNARSVVLLCGADAARVNSPYTQKRAIARLAFY